MNFYKPHEKGLILSIRLTPQARKDAIDGNMVLADGTAVLKASVTAAPEDDKANAALIALLSKKLGKPKRDIHILSGETNRMKTVLVEGLNEESLNAALT